MKKKSTKTTSTETTPVDTLNPLDINDNLERLKPFIGTTDTKVGEMVVYKNDEIVSLALATFGEYCDAEVQIMTRYLNNESVYLDIGTNIGYHALAINKYVGCAVQCFEPHPDHFTIAAYNCRDKPIRIYNTALGNSNGKITMKRFDPEVQGNYGEIKVDENNEGIEVTMIKLDQLEELARVDVMKIDVEGFEFQVLQGSLETILKHKPVIFYEAIEKEAWDPCFKFLRDLGYSQYWVTCRTKPLAPTYKQTEDNPFDVFGVSNILAIPNEIQQPLDLAPVVEGESFMDLLTRYQRYKLMF
jgi:FkbM family methyltransferase